MRRLATALAAITAAFACAGAAHASPYPAGPFAPWDGSAPFNCELQQAGTGVAVPDPGADPYCVEFDKTSQNLTDLGLVDFLALEPARVAAALPKCFYFQSDHWTGSVVQGVPPELWHWDGQYFFDRARGVGGVNIQNFRIAGQPASPAAYGDLPPEYAPYFDQGGGGLYLIADIDVDPTCVPFVDTPEERARVYAGGEPPPLPEAAPTGTTPAPAPAPAAKAKKCRKAKKAKRGRDGKRRRACRRR